MPAEIRSALVIHDQPDDFRAMLEARFPATRFTFATTPESVAPALADAQPEAVFSIKQASFPADAHRPAAAHPSVRWVHVGGSGYDHFLPWQRRDLRVTTCVGVLAPFLAETVMAGMLALNGNLLRYIEQQRKAVWQPLAFRPLAGQTLLVVGLGAIGGFVADYAKAMGMRVLAIRRQQSPHRSVDEMHPPEAMLDVIGRADVVSLHVRLSDETRGLIDARALARCKPGALLINTSRGPVVDEAALVSALQAGQLGGAYLDVFDTEPLPQSSLLWHLPNVLITPHASDNVGDWPLRLAQVFADNLERWRTGQPLINELQIQ
jgi:phosphoglycerate dehydrogenase-like enzyme